MKIALQHGRSHLGRVIAHEGKRGNQLVKAARGDGAGDGKLLHRAGKVMNDGLPHRGLTVMVLRRHPQNAQPRPAQNHRHRASTPPTQGAKRDFCPRQPRAGALWPEKWMGRQQLDMLRQHILHQARGFLLHRDDVHHHRAGT